MTLNDLDARLCGDDEPLRLFLNRISLTHLMTHLGLTTLSKILSKSSWFRTAFAAMAAGKSHAAQMKQLDSVITLSNDAANDPDMLGWWHLSMCPQHLACA